MDDEEFAKWKDKCRMFVIPSSNFIILERMISKLRMLKERGRVIKIGHKWSRGGGDSIAESLGATLLNCWMKEWCEGDIKGFDYSVKSVLMNLYFSGTLIYDDPTMPDHELKQAILDQIVKHMMARITNLFAGLWGIQRGGVPSGCLNTSHMDSWIMALYFFLFATFQIKNAPPEHQIELEEALITVIRIIVYGDDHNYRKGTGLAGDYFGATRFAAFLKKYFDVEMRDVKDGIPFCSVAAYGWLVDVGLTFLRHQFIVNPNKSEGQAVFLPYRETREFIARAVWGREPRARDVIDVLLSVMGHSYGTHGSNYDAWKSLKFFYEELLAQLPEGESGAIGKAIRRQDHTDLKKMRQHGITIEDLRKGYPSFDELQKRNIVDKDYQNISMDNFDELELSDVDWCL